MNATTMNATTEKQTFDFAKIAKALGADYTVENIESIEYVHTGGNVMCWYFYMDDERMVCEGSDVFMLYANESAMFEGESVGGIDNFVETLDHVRCALDNAVESSQYNRLTPGQNIAMHLFPVADGEYRCGGCQRGFPEDGPLFQTGEHRVRVCERCYKIARHDTGTRRETGPFPRTETIFDAVTIKKLGSEHGPCPWDQVTLDDGTVLVITDDQIALYESEAKYLDGSEPFEWMARKGAK